MAHGVTANWEDAFEGMAQTLGLSDHFHPKQQAVTRDRNGLTAIIGGRRSGKTELMVGQALELADLFPGEVVPYLGPTLRGMSNLVFPKVRELGERINTKFPISPGNFTVKTPNGGTVQLFGLSTLPDAEKGRGFRFPGVFIDEAGACNQDILKLAVTESFGPATADFHGMGGQGIKLGGTPPYQPDTYFEKVCGGNAHKSEIGATVHHMTIWDNPFFRGREEAVVQEWLTNNGLTKEASQYQREWLGRFCIDSLGLCYGKWNQRIYPRTEIPLTGITVLGLDLGHTAPNAWVVIRITPEYYLSLDKKEVEVRQVVHVLETYEENELGIDEIAEVTRGFCDAYNIGLLYGDGGGGGLQTISDLQNRYGLPFQNYKTLKGVGSKASRIWQIDTLLGNGGMKVHENCDSLVGQLKSVPWNEDRTGHDERFASHSLDGLIYSSLHDYSGLIRTVSVPPKPGSPEWINMVHERDIRRMMRGY